MFSLNIKDEPVIWNKVVDFSLYNSSCPELGMNLYEEDMLKVTRTPRLTHQDDDSPHHCSISLSRIPSSLWLNESENHNNKDKKNIFSINWKLTNFCCIPFPSSFIVVLYYEYVLCLVYEWKLSFHLMLGIFIRFVSFLPFSFSFLYIFILFLLIEIGIFVSWERKIIN